MNSEALGAGKGRDSTERRLGRELFRAVASGAVDKREIYGCAAEMACASGDPAVLAEEIVRSAIEINEEERQTKHRS